MPMTLEENFNDEVNFWIGPSEWLRFFIIYLFTCIIHVVMDIIAN